LTDEHKRKIAFWVDPWMWQAFYRLFPNHGARSAFLREAVTRAIELGPQSTMAKQIMDRINRDETID
jgi:hypothetical protein